MSSIGFFKSVQTCEPTTCTHNMHAHTLCNYSPAPTPTQKRRDRFVTTEELSWQMRGQTVRVLWGSGGKAQNKDGERKGTGKREGTRETKERFGISTVFSFLRIPPNARPRLPLDHKAF